MFKNKLAEEIFTAKGYQKPHVPTWDALSKVVVKDVCTGLLPEDSINQLTEYVKEMKFIPGGRYLYYAGREAKYYNNCFMLKAEEDTKEDWANLSWATELCLMCGGGVGVDYSVYRPKGALLKRTGGCASGPLKACEKINSIGRVVQQGGSRRSALYGSLHWKHKDVKEWIHAKDACNGYLDCTNISVNYDTEFLTTNDKSTFYENVKQALLTGEPGFSFNFYEKEKETLRNACSELCSEDNHDVCNLGSINLGNVSNIIEFQQIVDLATKFLVCGSIVGELPYKKVYEIREKNRRLGLGLMGIHEWLLKKGYRYEMNTELADWLGLYKYISRCSADELCDKLSISRPKGIRSIAPNGSLSLLASTTSGIEPLFAIAYKRRYIENNKWVHQYIIDSTAKLLIDQGVTNIESAMTVDYERRIKFQAEVQKYIDHCISSTINLPDTKCKVSSIAPIILKYCEGLRGLTFYPNGARDGQPLEIVSLEEAKKNEGKVFANDICIISKKSTCGG